MKNSLAAVALLLQACHSNPSATGPSKQALKAIELEHAKQNAERDRIAAEQQVKLLREHAAHQKPPNPARGAP
jgi:hypothetical protein